MQTLGQAIRWLNALMMAISASGVLLSLVLIAWSVIMRYCFNRPLVWVDEVVGFLLVAIVALAAADVLRRGQHIGVDILTARLSGTAKVWADAWAALAVLAVALIMLVNGTEAALFSRTLGIATEGHLELPQYWLMLFLPMCGVLLALNALETLLRLFLGLPPVITHSHRPEEGEP